MQLATYFGEFAYFRFSSTYLTTVVDYYKDVNITYIIDIDANVF